MRSSKLGSQVLTRAALISLVAPLQRLKRFSQLTEPSAFVSGSSSCAEAYQQGLAVCRSSSSWSSTVGWCIHLSKRARVRGSP